MIAALALLSSLLVGQGQPSPGLILRESVPAPTCSLVVEYYWPPKDRIDDPREVWLRSTAEPQRRVLLTTFGRDADVLFSPDCQAIALNDYAGSNVAFVRLFRRNANGGYDALPTADPTGAAWELFGRTYGIKDVGKWIGHMYCVAVAWTPGSGVLRIRLWGQDGPRNSVTDWYSVYDLATHQASLDLRRLNRAKVYVDGQLRR
jgi:hypothetical protein